MQKVVGSSPIIRLKKGPATGLFFVSYGYGRVGWVVPGPPASVPFSVNRLL
jgi:hypothetical protein